MARRRRHCRDWRGDELATLLRSARQQATLCRDGALVAGARDHDANQAVMAAAPKMHSDLLQTKHAADQTPREAAGSLRAFGG